MVASTVDAGYFIKKFCGFFRSVKKYSYLFLLAFRHMFKHEIFPQKMRADILMLYWDYMNLSFYSIHRNL